MSRRIQPYISDLNYARITALAAQPGKSIGPLVDAALDAYFASAPDGIGGHAILRRLDTLTRQFDRLEQKDLIIGETLALFIRYFMMTTPPVPAERQQAARTAGDLRFESFIEQLGIDLQSGRRILQRISEDIMLDETDLFTDEELDRLHMEKPARARAEVHDA
jgi:hypothetical protein